MQQSGVYAEFNNPMSNPATLFVPNNAAFDLLPAGKLTQLQDPNNELMLREFVQFHYVPSRMVCLYLSSSQFSFMYSFNFE